MKVLLRDSWVVFFCGCVAAQCILCKILKTSFNALLIISEFPLLSSVRAMVSTKEQQQFLKVIMSSGVLFLFFPVIRLFSFIAMKLTFSFFFFSLMFFLLLQYVGCLQSVSLDVTYSWCREHIRKNVTMCQHINQLLNKAAYFFFPVPRSV